MGSSASRGPRPAARSSNTMSAANLQTWVKQKDEEIQQLKREKKGQEEEITRLKLHIAQLEAHRPIAPPVYKPVEPQIAQPPYRPMQPPLLDPIDVISTDPTPSGNLPKVGDHVVSMWGASQWQYFTATIVDFDSNTLKYTIEWDDHDPTGRIVDYYNLALDKVPAKDQIGVGSKVLFHQGQYQQQQVEGGITRSGGLRWHQGEITKINTGRDGKRFFNGRHTKGANDGKWVTYKDYSEEFIGYTIEDFRMPPNVFDILDSVTGNNETDLDGIDVFVSYAKVNSPSAIKNREVVPSDLPPSYQEVMVDDLCDPREIVEYLRKSGVRVHCKEDESEAGLLEIVNELKRSKVFIACLSDEYASNDKCRMEFQFAKKTLKIPVIPLVVGTGSFQWKMTVVGLLIAGELYIHFKDKTVEGFKMNELLRSIKRHIPELELKDVQYGATGSASLNLVTTPGLTVTGSELETGQANIFFSYCWKNSKEAELSHQIKKCFGNEWNDPRKIAGKIKSQTGTSTWIDIMRLESAADGMGMFGQIATAIGECKVVVACVSDDYAASDNCRMEIQFAAASLKKPLVIAVVGEGTQWKETVVGKIADQDDAVVDLQSVSSEAELDNKIKDIINHVGKFIDLDTVPEGSGKTFKAPMIGDHVVCLHQSWGYFTATVVDFDSTDLLYTVDWDDGDPSGRIQSYKNVALDRVPDSDQIGVGSTVIFPQGSYGGTEGNNTGGCRYHQGKITKIYEEGGVCYYDGKHTKGAENGKWINWRGYNPTFQRLKLEDLRVSPNAMDALMACKAAFNLNQ